MIQSVMSLTPNGLRDWFIQRVTAVIIALYVIFLTGYILLHSQLDYAAWQGLFAHPFMRFFTFLTLLSIVAHAWIGIWTVLTDYVKVVWLRLVLEILMALALIFYLVWGIQILWR